MTWINKYENISRMRTVIRITINYFEWTHKLFSVYFCLVYFVLCRIINSLLYLFWNELINKIKRWFRFSLHHVEMYLLQANNLMWYFCCMKSPTLPPSCFSFFLNKSFLQGSLQHLDLFVHFFIFCANKRKVFSVHSMPYCIVYIKHEQ